MPSVELASRHGYQVLVSVGLVSYGIVHLVLAWISAQVALGGGGGGEASSTGALKELGQQPFGVVLLWVMAVGLLALVLWQGLEVVGGKPGADAKDQLKNRGKAAGRAVVYLVLGITAARIAVGAGSSAGSGEAEETLTARLMSVPFGRVLVVAVGVAILAVGISQIVKGVRRKFVTGRPRRWRRAVGGQARHDRLGRQGRRAGADRSAVLLGGGQARPEEGRRDGRRPGHAAGPALRDRRCCSPWPSASPRSVSTASSGPGTRRPRSRPPAGSKRGRVIRPAESLCAHQSQAAGRPPVVGEAVKVSGMGRNSRQRRAAKQRMRTRRGPTPTRSSDPAERVRRALRPPRDCGTASRPRSRHRQADRTATPAVDRDRAGPTTPRPADVLGDAKTSPSSFSRLVERELSGLSKEVLARLDEVASERLLSGAGRQWERGWQPRDLIHVAARIDKWAAPLAADVAVEQIRRSERGHLAPQAGGNSSSRRPSGPARPTSASGPRVRVAGRRPARDGRRARAGGLDQRDPAARQAARSCPRWPGRCRRRPPGALSRTDSRRQTTPHADTDAAERDRARTGRRCCPRSGRCWPRPSPPSSRPRPRRCPPRRRP